MLYIYAHTYIYIRTHTFILLKIRVIRQCEIRSRSLRGHYFLSLSYALTNALISNLTHLNLKL